MRNSEKPAQLYQPESQPPPTIESTNSAISSIFVVLKKDARDKTGRSTYGQPLNRHALKAMFRHYSRKNEVHLHAHMLRHSHATELIRANWDVSYVRKRLGHAEVQSIMTYIHLDDEDMAGKWQHFQEARRNDAHDRRGACDSADPDEGPMAILDLAAG